MIIVRDGRTGAELFRFEPADGVGWSPVLSADGSRLLLRAMGDAVPTLGVFDTRTGHLVNWVRTPGDVSFPPLIDAQAKRLYILGLTDTRTPPEPSPISIAAYDLDTGAEAGRVTLPDVLTGMRIVERKGQQTQSELTPGVALSPDGRRIAVVSAEADTVTLIDAQRMVVECSFSFARSGGLSGRLPFLPHEAEAKGFGEGTAKQAVFAPDGRHLYIFGYQGLYTAAGDLADHGLGLAVVDVTTGKLVAQAFRDQWIDQVMPAPDGHSVYVSGLKQAGDITHWSGEASTFQFRRLDPNSLHVLATREFAGEPRFLVQPAR